VLALGMATFTPNLAACETALQPAAGSVMFSSGRVNNLLLRKPGNGNEGSVGIGVNLGPSTNAPYTGTCSGIGGSTVPSVAANLPYLRGDWGSGSYVEDPTARATFGIHRNAEEFIYFRENY
jgi:MSHA biogenesis protein MshQ